MIRNKEHAWRVLEYQRELADAKAIANWDKEIAQWMREKAMAGYEQRVGSTNLFSNRDKKNEKQPDFKGTVEVQVGEVIVALDVALWEREGVKAGRYFGMTAKATGNRPVDDVERAMPREDEEIRF